MRLRPAHAVRRLLPVVVVSTVIAAAAGCGNDAGSTTTTSSGEVDATTTTAVTFTTSTTVIPSTTFVVTVKNGRIEPSPTRRSVRKDDMVTIEVTSDTDEEIHVHGYDKSADLKAGTPASVSFHANVAGVFEVELEHAHRKLLELEVR